MATNHLRVTFEQKEKTATDQGPDAEFGVPLEDVAATLSHIRMAMRETVMHLGGYESKGKRPPDWVAEESALKMFGVSKGSLVLDLALSNGHDHASEDAFSYGTKALEAILDWDGPGDDSVPAAAAKHLESIGLGLSSDVVSVRLADASNRRSVTIRRTEAPKAERRRRLTGWHDSARAHGMLMEVNWRKGTAQLHPTRPFPGERHIPLRFEASLSDALLQNARRFVTVSGRARFTEDDTYEVFHVEEVIPPRGNKPFSREELEDALARAKPYDPEQTVTASEPFDVEEFIRVIHEARDIS